MIRNFAATSAMAVLMLVSASAVMASDDASCKTFDVISTGEHRQASMVDLDESGAMSAGDKIVGYRQLVKADGSRAGDRYFVGTVIEVGADGKDLRRTTETVNVLEDGTIFTTKERLGGRDLASRINGGTGAYKGATGMVKMTREGTSNVYHFRVNCPQEKAS